MTTKQSLFWVEPGELSALLGRVGAVGSQREPAEQPAATAIPIVANGAGTNGGRPSVDQPSVDRPEFELPQGPLEERLTALLAWVHSVVDFEHAFVVGEDGLALVHESAPLELIAASAAISETWDSLRSRFALATENSLSLKLMNQQYLHLVTTPSEWGQLSLGIVARAPVSRANLAVIGVQFERTLEDKEFDRS